MFHIRRKEVVRTHKLLLVIRFEKIFSSYFDEYEAIDKTGLFSSVGLLYNVEVVQVSGFILAHSQQ